MPSVGSLMMNGAKWLTRHSVTKTERNMSNLYTGYKYTRFGKIAGGGGIIAGVGLYATTKGQDPIMNENIPTATDIPISRADMVLPHQSAPDMTDGSLVLALHSLRNGGYL